MNQRQNASVIGVIHSLTPWAMTKFPDQIIQAESAIKIAENSEFDIIISSVLQFQS